MQGQLFCKRLASIWLPGPQVRSYACGATPSGTHSSVPQSSLKLKFDTTTAHYNLSWRTPKNISGCQEMLLHFTGGVEGAVRFGFH